MPDMKSPPLNILLLCDRPQSIAATLHHHINALTTLSQHNVYPLPILGDLPKELDLERFDAVVIHWSLIILDENYISKQTRERLAAYSGLKCTFIQDEYKFIDRTIAAFQFLGIHVLFTCVPDGEIEKVYPEEKLPGVLKVNTLTGYVDDSLLKLKTLAYEERPIDVGYRARKVPAWLGELGQEKFLIGDRFKVSAKRHDLITDISHREEDRLYGDAWIKFLTNCRAVLGVESGASVFDFDGSIQAACEADIRVDPDISFETLRDRHFKDKEGLIRLNQISPRCFEAASLRTLMILYEGEYSRRMTPWRHYVPLKKDHSNIDEVVSVVKDPAKAKEIIEAAYDEVACNPDNSFGSFVKQFDSVLDHSVAKLGRPPASHYSPREFSKVARHGFRTRRNYLRRWMLKNAHHLVFRYLLGAASESTRMRARILLRSTWHRLHALVRGPSGE